MLQLLCQCQQPLVLQCPPSVFKLHTAAAAAPDVAATQHVLGAARSSILDAAVPLSGSQAGKVKLLKKAGVKMDFKF